VKTKYQKVARARKPRKNQRINKIKINKDKRVRFSI
jgi:hypothetical protein